MALWHTFSKVSFYPTLAYNLILEKITNRQWYSRIDDTVLLGALPFKSMTKQLVEDEDVRGVISLNEDFELEKFVNTEQEWKTWGVQLLRLRTLDFVASPSQVYICRNCFTYLVCFSLCFSAVMVLCLSFCFCF